MPRVNLEESFFASRKLAKLQEHFNWSRASAIGTLALLWHESQDKMAIDATESEICDWCWLDDWEGQIEPSALVSALVRYGFIVDCKNGRYKIVGNETQIRNRVQKYEAAKLGGEKTKQKWEEFKKLESLETEAVRPSDATPSSVLRPTTMQGNAVQSKAKQGKAKEGVPSVPAVASPAKQVSDGPKVWDAYRQAYSDRYGHDPVRNAKVNRHCIDLISRLGLDDAVKVVQFYLTHTKAFYLEKAHMLQYCLFDCEALRTQMKHGVRFTAQDARRNEIKSKNSDVFSDLTRELIEKRKQKEGTQ